jgi:hypothetical protein
MPSCSRPSRTRGAAGAVARRRAILDRRCARRRVACAGRDGRMVPIEQKDCTGARSGDAASLGGPARRGQGQARRDPPDGAQRQSAAFRLSRERASACPRSRTPGRRATRQSCRFWTTITGAMWCRPSGGRSARMPSGGGRLTTRGCSPIPRRRWTSRDHGCGAGEGFSVEGFPVDSRSARRPIWSSISRSSSNESVARLLSRP